MNWEIWSQVTGILGVTSSENLSRLTDILQVTSKKLKICSGVTRIQ